ncbi:MAG: TRAP transporter TatT component family protein [Deltaproteobacteria bacterium]
MGSALPVKARPLVLAVLLSSLAVACDMTSLAARSSAGLFRRASVAFDEQSDYELARQAAPAFILQFEGLLRVVPDDEDVLFSASKAWSSYAFGFIEDEMLAAEARREQADADLLRTRARRMYARARELGLQLLERMAPGMRAATRAGPEPLSQFVRREFDDATDAPALFWTGVAWGQQIDISRDDPALIADLALPRVLVQRSVDLDESYQQAAGHTFLGYDASILSPALGGDPELGREHFERALALTRRDALLVQLNYARSYATQTQRRELFAALLNEVVTAPDRGSDGNALANQVARRRAQHLLDQIDELFPAAIAPGQPAAPGRESSSP